MLIIGLTTYVLVSLAFGVALIRAPRPHRRSEQLFDGYDRALLAATGVAASTAWPLLLPIYAAGWLGSAEAARLYRRADARWQELQGRVLRLVRLRRTAH